MKYPLLILACLLFGVTVMFAAGAETKSNNSLKPAAGQVGLYSQDPAQRFRALLEEGYARLETQQYGRAALAFEKALLITDAFPPLRQNLHKLRQRTGADRYEVHVHPLVRAIFFLYYSCTVTDLTRILIVFTALAAIVTGLLVLYRQARRLLLRVFVAAIYAFLFASMLALLYHHQEALAPERGVMLEETGLFARLGKDEVPLVRLPAATAVRVVQRGEGMVRIFLPGGAAGWVQAQTVGIINE